MVNHPKEARFLLPLYYNYIENELPKICEETGADYQQESRKIIESAMQVGDAVWDRLSRGLTLLEERFRKA